MTTYDHVVAASSEALGYLPGDADEQQLRPQTRLGEVTGESIDLADIFHRAEKRLDIHRCDKHDQWLKNVAWQDLTLADVTALLEGRDMDAAARLDDRLFAALEYVKPGIAVWLRSFGVLSCRYITGDASSRSRWYFPGIKVDSRFCDLSWTEPEQAMVVMEAEPPVLAESGNPFEPERRLRLGWPDHEIVWADALLMARHGVQLPPAVRQQRRTPVELVERCGFLCRIRCCVTGAVVLDDTDLMPNSLSYWRKTEADTVAETAEISPPQPSV